jgi:hypothetical protein
MNEILGYTLDATDGELGSVHDFYFDDDRWTTRYLVVDTGNWLPGRRVLISPVAIRNSDWGNQRLSVALTRSQIEQSPGIEADLPVSRQKETQLVRYYGWVPYWQPAGTPVGAAAPIPIHPPRADTRAEHQDADPSLRSIREVKGYRIEARDGLIGHVEDFIGDTDGWSIRYITVDTRNWLPGKKVVIPPSWAERVDWQERRLHIDETRDRVRHAPELDFDVPVDREVERRFHDYYGRPGYWK